MTDETDDSLNRKGKTVALAWGVIALVTATGIVGYVTVNQLGPRVLWASDVCPDPATVCGNMPLIIIVGSLVGAIVAAIGIGVTGTLMDNSTEKDIA